MTNEEERGAEIPHQSRLLVLGSLAMLAGLAAFGYLVVNFAGGTDTTSETLPTASSLVIDDPAEEIGPTTDDPATDDSITTDPAADLTAGGQLAGDYTVEIIESYPSSPSAFTQGLELIDGRLLRSNGMYGSSKRQWVDPATGLTETSVDLANEFFGEGITVADGEVYQLTWQEQQVFIADLDDLSEQRTATYSGEGWGLCFDGEQLIRSDGTNVLSFHEPGTFELLGSVEVTDGAGTPVNALNELECVNGQVIANIYLTEQIVVIDPNDGSVDASIDGSGLRPDDVPFDSAHALNGVAYIAEDGTFYVTGKYWPTLHKVRLVPVDG